MYQPKYTITNQTLKSISRIIEGHTLIVGTPLKPKWEAGLRYQALVRSVHSSTHLEGNPLTEQEVAQVLRGKEPKRAFRKRDILEVTNYRQVLQYIAQAHDEPGLKIDEDAILHLHKLCVQGIEGMESQAGRYRSVQNYIVAGPQRTVVYTPPPPEKVPGLMEGLVQWLVEAQRQQVSPFIVSAIAHYEFESIHPFVDGNGRTGRALSTLILYKMGYDTKSFFSLEEYFDAHPDEYYGNLGRIRKAYGENPNPDLTEWVEFFVHAIEVEMDRVESEVKVYLAQEHLRRDLKQQEINARQFKAVVYLQKRGSLQSHEYAQRFRCSRDTAVRDLRELMDKGLIEPQGAGPQLRYVLKR